MDAQTLSTAMGCSLARATEMLPGMENAMRAAQITTSLRAAHWCSQIGHESVGLQYMEEIASGAAYNGRADLGNVQPGDGPRYKGSGPIQLTGRNNFRAFTRWANAQGHTNLDFEAQPQLVRSNPKWGFLAASWYWTVARPQLNAQADRDDVEAVTRSINGGTNGIADRRARLARCKGLGNRLLPSAASSSPSRAKSVEKVLDYSRSEIKQDTYYWCGPATAQLLLHTRTKNMVAESVLAKELGTTVNGTNGVVQIARVLNARMGGNWTVGAMPNDPPKQDEKELLWKRIVGSINGRVGVAANIWVPPSNYPRASYTSTQNLQYGGGFVMHYLCVMGYAVDAAGKRHVWLADSGFKPHGSWVTFDQFATMIPPREYAYAADWQGSTETTQSEEDDMFSDTDRLMLSEIRNQMTGSHKVKEFPGWPQLGGLTPVDALALILDQMVGYEKDEKTGEFLFNGWKKEVVGNGGKTLIEAVAELQVAMKNVQDILQSAQNAADEEKGTKK
ncbi:basic endochitinase [Corynebacterium sp.]|uniref:basic endochitinase n=1 Tax=Corynebacterium sp. TaxID=1720 RepID=UPI003B3B61CB